MRFNLGLLTFCTVLSVLAASAAHAVPPEQTIRDHFARIDEEDFVGAEHYFSAAYRAAFKAEGTQLEAYYQTRRQQLSAGYDIIASQRLTDPDRETVRITVDFRDPAVDADVTATERMNYYLIREKTDEGEPLRDAEGKAWRIDIYDALSFDTLAEARRRPYLDSTEAWSEDDGNELKARQGMFRIQQALESYKQVNGEYPDKLRGGDNRRDELVSSKDLLAYPVSGYSDNPMLAVELEQDSDGDFTYFPISTDAGARTGYFLLLHGSADNHFLFQDLDIVFILGHSGRSDQVALAREFAAWYGGTGGQLQPGAGLPKGWGKAAQAAAE